MRYIQFAILLVGLMCLGCEESGEEPQDPNPPPVQQQQPAGGEADPNAAPSADETPDVTEESASDLPQDG